MEPRNTLNTRKDLDSSGLESEFFGGEGEQWKGFDNWIDMRREGEI